MNVNIISPVIYKKTQTSLLLLVISAVIIVAQMFMFFSESKFFGEVSLSSFLFITIILLLTLLLFSRLTIQIDKEIISGFFGFGIFKQKMRLVDIDAKTIEVIEAPLYYGVGLRFTPKGTLYNTKPGKAIRLKSKDGSKTFFVGTEEAEQIKTILLNQLD
jgi:hypothetical protein